MTHCNRTPSLSLLVAFISLAILASSASAQQYRATRIGNPVHLTEINGSGAVVGYQVAFESNVILWVDGTLSYPLGFIDALAFDVSDNQHIVGMFFAGGAQRPFLWHDGASQELPILGSYFNRASSVNSRGEAVGFVSEPVLLRSHAVLWSDGIMTDLGTLGGLQAEATCINERGQVAGWSYTPNGRRNAFLWSDGNMTNLGFQVNSNQFPVYINNLGQLAGTLAGASGETHAFFWSDGVLTTLGSLGGSRTVVTGLNDLGQVVGYSEVLPFGDHAFLWQYGRISDLNLLLPTDFPRELTSANGINNAGEIIAATYDTGYFLTPTGIDDALAGNVNATNGGTVNVIFANSSPGSGPLRRITIDSREAFELSAISPPSREGRKTPLVIYAWLGQPTTSTVTPLPFGLGTVSMPTPLAGVGPPNPVHIWNTLGFPALLGSPTLPSSKAPTILLQFRGGLRRKGTFTVQGFILDAASPNGQAAVTNGLVITSE